MVPPAREAEYRVRPAAEEEFPRLIALFNRVFRWDKDARTFRWKYLDNPHGRAVVWVAEAPASGEIVGSLAFVPRRIRVGGKTFVTFLASDGMVLEEWQRKGIFVRLLGIMFERSWEREAPFVTAFTGRRSVPGLLRTGWKTVGTILEMELPLRGRRLFRRVLHRLPALEGPLGRAGDVLLERGAAGRLLRRRPASRVVRVERFDEDLARAGEEALAAVEAAMVRDRAFLDWRYVDNPTQRHTCWGAYREGRAAGYMVMEARGEAAYVTDLLAADPEVRADLLARAVQEAHRAGCAWIQCMALEGDPMSAFFRAQGFRPLPRERLLPFMMKEGPAAGELAGRVLDPRRWYLSHGDRDAEHMTR